MSERRIFDPVWCGSWRTMPEDAALLVEGEPDVSRLLSVVYDPDVGTLAEVQLPDGRLVYGFDPALPR